MKDFTQMKNYYKIAGICLGAGAACIIASYCLSGFSFSNLGKGSNYSERTESFSASEVKRLIIEEENTEIEIKAGSTDQITFHLFERDTDYYDVLLNDGTLQVLKNSDDAIFRFDADFSQSRMIVELPASMLGSVEVNNDNGDIDASGINAENLVMSTSNASISLTDSTVEKDITLTDDNASYRIDSVTCGGKFNASTSNSSVEVSNIDASDLYLKTSNGQINAGTLAAGTIELKTSNARIEADGIHIEKSLKMETSNGKIHAQLDGSAGEYSVSCTTSNGTCNAPDGNGSKTVQINSSNANIQVETE